MTIWPTPIAPSGRAIRSAPRWRSAVTSSATPTTAPRASASRACSSPPASTRPPGRRWRRSKPSWKTPDPRGSGDPPGLADRARRGARAGRARRGGRRRRLGGRTLGAAPGGRHRRRAGARAPGPPPSDGARTASPGERSRRDRRDAGLARRGRDAALSSGARDRPRRDRDGLPGARRGARSVGRSQAPAPAADRGASHGGAGAVPGGRAAPGRAATPGRGGGLRRRRAGARAGHGMDRRRHAAGASRPPTRTGCRPSRWRRPRAAFSPPWRFCMGRGSSTATSSRRTSSCGPPARWCWPTSAARCRLTAKRARARLGEAGGTPLYLAPEQFQGAAASGETDLYAAGAILWEAATGARSGATPTSSSAVGRRTPTPPARRGRRRPRSDCASRCAPLARASPPPRPRLFWLFLIRPRRSPEAGLGGGAE